MFTTTRDHDRAVGRSGNPGIAIVMFGHNQPPLDEIGLIDLPKSGGTMHPLPGTTGLHVSAAKIWL